jgi:MGT family glycosyltransferase
MAKRRRFLFVTFDGGGNVPPALGLVRRLVRRGHEVRVLGPSALAERITDSGGIFRAFSRELDWGPPAPGVMAEENPNVAELLAIMCSLELAQDVIAEAETADVLVVDCMLPAALLAAERIEAPTVALVHTLYQWWAEGGPRDAALGGVPDPFGAAMLPLVNQTRAELGLQPLRADIRLMGQLMDRARLALAATLEQLDRPLAAPHPNLRYVGPVLDEESPSWEPPGHPLVLVSFSSTYMHQEDALRRTLEAAGSLDVQAVCTLGNALGGETLHAPANVVIHDWLPHSAVLPHAAAVVTHAGHSTVMAALAEGVPMICMPMGRDQNSNAERVAALGLGRTISKDATSAEIRAALHEVLSNESYRIAARRMAAVITGLGRGERAVIELEALHR